MDTSCVVMHLNKAMTIFFLLKHIGYNYAIIEWSVNSKRNGQTSCLYEL